MNNKGLQKPLIKKKYNIKFAAIFQDLNNFMVPFVMFKEK